jgi:hypothetical protein
MQDKTTKNLDSRGAYTLFGVFNEVEDEVNKEIDKIPIGRTRVKRITYRLFGDIIRMYFKICFREVIVRGYGFPLLNKFGELRAVKTLATRYNPTTFTWVKENGKAIRKLVKLDLNKTNGYMFFVFWDCPKKYRHFKLKLSPKWKSLLFKQYQDGMEFPDISVLAYGRTASDSYIQKIK